MATAALNHLWPRDGVPTGNGNPVQNVGVGAVVGVGFNKQQTSGICWLWRVPTQAALATGLTFSLIVADDPNNADPGKVVRFSIIIGPVATGTLVDEATALASSNETGGSVTMNATSGKNTIASIAVVNADMNSLAVGNWALIRLRRLGTNSADTHRGRAVLLNATVYDT